MFSYLPKYGLARLNASFLAALSACLLYSLLRFSLPCLLACMQVWLLAFLIASKLACFLALSA